MSAWKWPISCSLWLMSYAVLERAGRDAALDALDERPVLPADLVVEGEQVVDPGRLDVGAEEVVEEAVRAAGRERHDRPDRDVRPAGEDVDPEVRPEEMELRARQLVLRRGRAQWPVLRREAPVGREHVCLGRDVETSLKAGCATWQW